MIDAVRKLIMERLEALNLTMAEASVRIGKNAAYVQQFLKRGIPRELGETERARLAAILGVNEADLRGPSAATLSSRNYTKPDSAAAPRNARLSRTGHNILDNPSPSPPLFGNADLPVFGTAQGGQGGALIMTGEAVDYVVRPAPLLRVKDGYGMIVAGDSMSPQFENGSTALVNPHLPPRPGDTCVFRNHQDDGTVLALIKKLRRFTDDAWFVSQFNPPRDFQLKRSEWQICHSTVGIYFT